VAFDLDGTLFDSCSVSQVALREGFEAFWAEIGEEGPVPSWECAKALLGLPTYEFFPALLPDAHRESWKVLHRHVGICEKHRLEEGRGLTFEGVHETLEELAKLGYFLGCLSNASRIYFDAVLDGCDLRRHFHQVAFLGESPETTKADVLRRWAVELGGPDRLIYVGDRSVDVEAAHAAGLKAVGVAFGHGSREELSEAEAVIDKMNDLPEVIKTLMG
jgi:phosphoglycolate phosphatase